MAVQKQDLRAYVQNHIDDLNSKFWSNTNLDFLIQGTMEEKWTELLRVDPFLLSTTETITAAPKLVTPGYIDLAQLTNRFHAIQSLIRDDKEYDKAHSRDVVLKGTTLLVGPDLHYTKFGARIYLFPLSTTSQIDLRYSYRPALFTGLGSTDPVTWPEGFENALIFECASRAMTKGDREENARIDRLAKDSWDSLITFIRDNRTPVVPFDFKSKEEWGSV
jgi:hypothetical protein